METSTQSGLESASSGLPPVLSVWDAISWIAFRDMLPRPDLPDAVAFTLEWGSSFAAHTLTALAARTSDCPYCIWDPLILDGQPWDGKNFKHVAWSPDGPKMLRWIVRQLSAKSGRNVPFAEAARMLREGLEQSQRGCVQTDRALRDLIHALRVRRLLIWAKRDLPDRKANPSAQYECLDAGLFLDELVSVTEWGTVGPDPELPVARFKYCGPTFREGRLYTADILGLWPAPQFADRPPELRTTSPIGGYPDASPSDGSVEMLIGAQGVEPPSGTLPWAVFRVMELLGYPADRAWNLLDQAIREGEVAPRRGTLWFPGHGPKLEQLERDNLDFDFRRYQADARTGGPTSSLRIGSRSLHPHEITIPAEEIEHWLASQMAQSPSWVNGDKVADWWARQRGAVDGRERIELYNEACRSICRGVLAGEFTNHFLHPHLAKHGSVERVLPAGPNVVHGTWFSGDEDIKELRRCVRALWLPAAAVQAWLTTHRMDWPLPTHPDSGAATAPIADKTAFTVKNQTRWRDWLTEQMRASPAQPRSKAAMRKEGKAAGLPDVSDRGLERAWGAAATAAQAPRWREGGRRPSSQAKAR